MISEKTKTRGRRNEMKWPEPFGGGFNGNDWWPRRWHKKVGGR